MHGHRRWSIRAAASALLIGGVGVGLVGSTAATPPAPPEELVFRSNRAGVGTDLYLIGRDGSNFRRLTFTAARERAPRISPDGKWVAFSSNAAGNFDIWVVRRNGGEPTQVSSDPAFEDTPVWLPDGRIAFHRGPFACSTPCSIAVAKRDGSGQTTLPVGPIGGGGFDVSPDGAQVLYGSGGSLYRANADGSGTPVQVTTAGPGGLHFRPTFSPDGTRFAYLEDPNGADNELFVANLDGSGAAQLTATPGRHEEYPSWSADGSHILFMTFGSENRLRQIRPDGTGEEEVSTTLRAPWTDTFSRAGRDSSIWHEWTSGTGATAAQAGGRVELALPAGATPGGEWNTVGVSYGSHCRLPGDFAISVGYEALEYPAANGTYAGVQAHFANANVTRASQAWGEQYAAWLDGVGGQATTEENAGALRLVREGGRLRGFWRYAGVWVPLRSAPANGNSAMFGFDLQAFGGQFAGQTVRVAFDDFKVESGTVECPDWWKNADFGDFG